MHQRPMSFKVSFLLVSCRSTYLSCMKIIVNHSSLGNQEITARPIPSIHRQGKFFGLKFLSSNALIFYEDASYHFTIDRFSLPSTTPWIIRGVPETHFGSSTQENGLDHRGSSTMSFLRSTLDHPRYFSQENGLDQLSWHSGDNGKALHQQCIYQ